MNRTLHVLSTAFLCSVVPLSAHAQISSNASQGLGENKQPTITELPTPTATSLPQGVDIAANGDIWYAETSAGKIAVLRTSGVSTEFPLATGGQPVTVKVAYDGIWFTDGPGHAIGYLNPATGKIAEYVLPSGAAPLFLQLASDGSKWFSEPTGVGRLAPNGVITEWSVTLEHADDNIEQLSIDPYGNIWFVERNFDGAGAAGTNSVRRLKPQTNVISTYLVPTLGGNPAGVQTNANGTVWVSEYFANAFALLDPLVAPHSDAVVAPNAHAAGTTASTARLNFTGRNAGTTTKVAPSTAAVKPVRTSGWIEYFIPTANAQAEDMRIDLFGRVWFEGDTGLLGVLNPYNAVFSTVTIPSPNSGYYDIALDQVNQRLWFTEVGAFAPVPTKIGYLSLGDQ